jgi:hypothetical protein
MHEAIFSHSCAVCMQTYAMYSIKPFIWNFHYVIHDGKQKKMRFPIVLFLEPKFFKNKKMKYFFFHPTIMCQLRVKVP